MVVLLGPGGVGKSTLGRAMAGLAGWDLVDLDLVFCDSIGEIGAFIGARGYERYREENLALAQKLVAEAGPATLLVTSSGFLAGKAGTEDHAAARALVDGGYGVTLLPSLDVEAATEIVVARQLTRGFGLERDSERRKFRDRFDIYRREGDMLVVSTEAPERIAAAVLERLAPGP